MLPHAARARNTRIKRHKQVARYDTRVSSGRLLSTRTAIFYRIYLGFIWAFGNSFCVLLLASLNLKTVLPTWQKKNKKQRLPTNVGSQTILIWLPPIALKKPTPSCLTRQCRKKYEKCCDKMGKKPLTLSVVSLLFIFIPHPKVPFRLKLIDKGTYNMKLSV